MLARVISLPVAFGLLAACQTLNPIEQPIASANLIRSDGSPAGTILAYQEPTGLLLRIDASGLPPGQHGVHLHSAGRCEPPAFASAGPHWNPAARQHGHRNPAGWHSGDLGNLGVGADGKLRVGLLVPGTALRAVGPGGGAVLADADGTALVIHSHPDDERTDPGGNSGDRIACAVIVPAP